MMSTPTQTSPAPVSLESALEWLDHAMQVVNASAWGPLLKYRGVDLVDSLLTPAFLAVLAASREALFAPRPSKRNGVYRTLHNRLFEMKSRFLHRRAIRLASLPRPTQILLWPRDRVHIPNTVAVARALALRGAEVRIVTCQPHISHLVIAAGMDPYFLPTLWDRELPTVDRWIGQRTQELLSRDDFPLLADAPANDLRPQALRQVLIQGVESVVFAVNNAQRALSAFAPRLLIVGNDITVEGRVAARVAHEQNVYSVTQTHGLIFESPMNARHIVDKLLTLGERGLATIAHSGFPSERLVIGGAPALDQRPVPTRLPVREISARCGVSKGQKYFLVLTSGPGHSVSLFHHLECVRNLMRLSAAYPQAFFVAKLHPKDDYHYYENLQREIPDAKLQVVPHATPGYPTSILEWMQGAAAILTCASTSATEAMLMDVPVITMDFMNEIDRVDFIRNGATDHVTSYEELTQAVERVLRGDVIPESRSAAVHDYLENHFSYRDRTATERTVDILLDLAKLPPRIIRDTARPFRSPS
jgi:hypothetical protein